MQVKLNDVIQHVSSLFAHLVIISGAVVIYVFLNSHIYNIDISLKE